MADLIRGAIGIAVALVFIYVAARRVKLYRSRRQTLKWERGSGQITWSVLEERTAEGWRGDRYQRFIPQIRFRFVVAGSEYESDQLFRGGFWPAHLGVAREWLDRFPAGKEVPVFVNPENHAEAVLVQGDPTATQQFSYMVLFAVAATVILWANPFD